MNSPAATYRVQLSPDFPLEDLQKIVTYLGELGVSTVYSAPFFQARKGSTHGYDITDPFTINTEIGSLEDFREVRQLLADKEMDWLQDIVPNHMAFDGRNPWLRDIFELGPDSRFYNFFDIDWDYKGWKKVLAPFLGNSLEEVIDAGELQLKLNERHLSIDYYDQKYAVSARSYPLILERAEAGKWIERFSRFAGGDEQWEELKETFFSEVKEDPQLKDRLRKAISEVNASKERFQEILDLQYYLPAHWKKTEEEINYRRFFTINGLICLKMEDPEVFETYHYYINELCEEGLIDGLRIDHVDGLFDPKAYLESLREMVGKKFYIIVEKILEADENLPLDWPVQGTSGYEFLAQVNHLYTETGSEDSFTEAYDRINPRLHDYEDLVYQKKLFILKKRMGGELHNLWLLLKDSNLLPAQEIQKEEWMEALCSFLAAFPVYRIYPKEFPLNRLQKETVEKAYSKALAHCSEREKELSYFKSLFLGEAEKKEDQMFYFLQRCQQFTGPLAAKGVEDTSFYIYNRLISHNEVGDSPENFGIPIAGFHKAMQERRQDFPLSVNGTATHDTKRGEDARMRLNVLSEIPEQWFAKLREWKEINTDFFTEHRAPDDNEEYFIYQSLIGALPFAEENQEDFFDRTKEYLQKVLREAKVHSNWATPAEDYENAVFDFVSHILSSDDFRRSFDPFQRKIALFGVIKSLGQCLLKVTAPGIPDVFQGRELWDLSYVDPDNRRPVDYQLRKQYLEELKSATFPDDLHHLKRYFFNGKIKMLCLHKSLTARRNHQELFETGDYLPLKVTGKFSESIIAYARRKDEKWFITLAPVLITDLFNAEELRPEPDALKEVFVELPPDAPKQWKNIFTEETMDVEQGLYLENIFMHFPVALLTN